MATTCPSSFALQWEEGGGRFTVIKSEGNHEKEGGLERWQFVRVVTVTLFMNMRLIFQPRLLANVSNRLTIVGSVKR